MSHPLTSYIQRTMHQKCKTNMLKWCQMFILNQILQKFFIFFIKLTFHLTKRYSCRICNCILISHVIQQSNPTLTTIKNFNMIFRWNIYTFHFTHFYSPYYFSIQKNRSTFYGLYMNLFFSFKFLKKFFLIF